jgi:hypothetical protein
MDLSHLSYKTRKRLANVIVMQPIYWVAFLGSEAIAPCERRTDIHWWPLVAAGLLLFSVAFNVGALALIDRWKPEADT